MIMQKKNPDNFNPVPVDQELNEQHSYQAEYADEDFIKSVKPDSRRNERIIAFNLIYAADRFDYTVDLADLVQTFQYGYDLPVDGNEFIIKLANGVVNDRSELDQEITPFLKNWRLDRLGCCTRLILRIALWELEHDQTPSSIIINEAVELAKLFAEKDAYKFVNGILDEIVKTRDEKAGIESNE